MITQIMINTNDGKYEYYRERYLYNDKKQLIELQTCKRGHKDKNDLSNDFTNLDCSYKEEYIYDQNGNVIKSTYYFPSWAPVIGIVTSKNPQLIITFEYNETNKLIKSTISKEDGGIEKIILNNYDDNGNIIQIIENDSQGTVLKSTIQSYTDGKLTMKMVIDPVDGSSSYMYSYKYNETGTQIQIVELDPSTQKEKLAYIASFK